MINCKPHMACLALCVFLAIPALAKDQKLTADELVAQHLQSIGTPEARAAAKSRVAEGKITFRDRLGSSNQLAGSALFMSQGTKFKCAFNLGAPNYPGEQIVFDGHKYEVAFITANTRSGLGGLLFGQPDILREGLFGGTISTAWPLLDLKARQAKAKYEGVKKIDGRELHDLTYVPNKSSSGSDLTIHLYFEPDTFRHVMTVYRMRTRIVPGASWEATDETIETVEERFSDFRTVDGITLPGTWEIRYHREPGETSELQWQVVFDRFTHNALK